MRCAQLRCHTLASTTPPIQTLHFTTLSIIRKFDNVRAVFSSRTTRAFDFCRSESKWMQLKLTLLIYTREIVTACIAKFIIFSPMTRLIILWLFIFALTTAGWAVATTPRLRANFENYLIILDPPAKHLLNSRDNRISCQSITCWHELDPCTRRVNITCSCYK